MRHNTDKMVMHTMVQGLEYAAIFKDFMEEYVTNDNLQTHLPTSIQKIYKNLLMPKRAPKGAWLRSPWPHGTTNKLSNYHGGKKIRRSETTKEVMKTPGPGRSGTKPDSRPTCTSCN